jgi:hypothetical protein
MRHLKYAIFVGMVAVMIGCGSAKEITMDSILSMYEDGGWVSFVEDSTILDWEKYENVTENTDYGASLTGMYQAALSYREREYNLQIYYWPDMTAKQYGYSAGCVDMILLTEPDTGDGIALYRSDWNEEQNETQDLSVFLDKEYDVTADILFEMPQSDVISTDITLGEYKADLFLEPFAGSLFVSTDYSEPEHAAYTDEGWYSLGGIEELQNPDEEIVSYDNGVIADIKISGNHMCYEQIESFETDDFEGLLYTYEFDLYTAADMAELTENISVTSSYWVAFLSEGEGQPIYAVFLNADYFTKEQALNCAKSFRLK